MKAIEQYFIMTLFIMLYKVILTLFGLKMKFWSATIQVNKKRLLMTTLSWRFPVLIF